MSTEATQGKKRWSGLSNLESGPGCCLHESSLEAEMEAVKVKVLHKKVSLSVWHETYSKLPPASCNSALQSSMAKTPNDITRSGTLLPLAEHFTCQNTLILGARITKPCIPPSICPLHVPKKTTATYPNNISNKTIIMSDKDTSTLQVSYRCKYTFRHLLS